MGAIPFAFSVHHFISSVGADAGFAAIIGLALLVLLFFAQSRETASLRQRAADSDDQLHRLELYVDQLARSPASSAAVSSPVPAPTGMVQPAARGATSAFAPAPSRAGGGSPVLSRTIAPTPAPAGAVARAPGAPAGVAAPALGAATRLIPESEPISVHSLEPAASSAAATDGRVATREAGGRVLAPPSPPPSTAAGGANGSGVPRVVPPPLVVGAGGNQPPPRVALRRNEPISSSRLSSSTASPGGSRVSRVAIAIATVLVVVAAVVALLLLTSGGSGKSATASRTSSTKAITKTLRAGRAKIVVVTPSSVMVAVLNGTTTTNLAHDTMARLTALGYKQGAIQTATNQTLSTTIVAFTSPAYRRDALAVAKSLGLKSASVQAINQSNRTVACGATPSACPAQVVVTVGSDLSSNT